MSPNTSPVDPPRSLLSGFCQRYQLDEAAIRRRLDAPRPRWLRDDNLRQARREAIDNDNSDRRFRERILPIVENAIAPVIRAVQTLRRDLEAFKAHVPHAIAAGIDACKEGAA